MSSLKTASLAILLAALSLSPAHACDYSMKSDVTADAALPAHPVAGQQASAAAAASSPPASIETALPPTPAQTAEAVAEAADQPKPN